MRKTILVIEDDHNLRENICEILSLEGYSIKVATNGEEGLDLIRKDGEVDLVLSDVKMPKLDGVELITFLKSELAHRSLPVLFLTASTEKAGVQQLFELGADQVVFKPFNDEDLINSIKKII